MERTGGDAVPGGLGFEFGRQFLSRPTGGERLQAQTERLVEQAPQMLLHAGTGAGDVAEAVGGVPQEGGLGHPAELALGQFFFAAGLDRLLGLFSLGSRDAARGALGGEGGQFNFQPRFPQRTGDPADIDAERGEDRPVDDVLFELKIAIKEMSPGDEADGGRLGGGGGRIANGEPGEGLKLSRARRLERPARNLEAFERHTAGQETHGEP